MIQLSRSIYITLESSDKDPMWFGSFLPSVFSSLHLPTMLVFSNRRQDQISALLLRQIQQTSGEDWNDVELLLSTASPRSGGLPKLPTLKAQLVKPILVQWQEVNNSTTLIMQEIMEETMGSGGMQLEGVMLLSLQCKIVFAASTCAEASVVHNFSIPQKKTIPSDTSEHKVTIAVLDLSSLLRLDCVPSKDTQCFPGTASVYVDNSFSSKVPIKSVASGERFDCPLGVDPLIKVDYKPSHNYPTGWSHQQVGYHSA
uniref:DUF4139 domain-containing protein n=1 Tax=Ditylenchus dipsaci TaxID=166011 RepID=A0A915DXW2_9BILA